MWKYSHLSLAKVSFLVQYICTVHWLVHKAIDVVSNSYCNVYAEYIGWSILSDKAIDVVSNGRFHITCAVYGLFNSV